MVIESSVVCTKVLWLTGAAFGFSVLASWMRATGFALLERFLVLCLALGFALGALLLGLGILPLIGQGPFGSAGLALVGSLTLVLVASLRMLSLLRNPE